MHIVFVAEDRHLVEPGGGHRLGHVSVLVVESPEGDGEGFRVVVAQVDLHGIGGGVTPTAPGGELSALFELELRVEHGVEDWGGEGEDLGACEESGRS